MPDLTSQLLPQLETHQLPGLDLPSDFIAPQYDGQSILNIPASICRWMDIPEIGAAPLIPEIDGTLGNGIRHGEGVRRVILILMDALSLYRLQRWTADGTEGWVLTRLKWIKYVEVQSPGAAKQELQVHPNAQSAAEDDTSLGGYFFYNNTANTENLRYRAVGW